LCARKRRVESSIGTCRVLGVVIMKRFAELIRSNLGITLLLLAFLLLAGIYSIVNPIFEASDELWHYPFVKTLADGNGLPVQDAQDPGPWRQEGSQPPLYYLIAAAVTSGIDTTDIDYVRRINPHVDNAAITRDGNNNLVVHRTEIEQWPWTGTVLAVHVSRFLSVLMGAGTVFLTYLLALELFGDRKWLALTSAALIAFTPMFLFVSGSVNNDNLVVVLATATLYLLVRMVRRAEEGRSTTVMAAAAGILVGLAVLGKLSGLGLIGPVGLTLLYMAWKRRSWKSFLLEGALVVGVAALVSGWWLWRNWTLYGDPTGLNAFVDIAGGRPGGSTPLVQLWGERVGFVWSYWGLFGGLSVPMPEWIYALLNTLAAIALAGLALLAIRLVARRDRLEAKLVLPLIISSWIPIVFISLIRWTTMVQASQGRLIFSTIAPLNILMAAGLGLGLSGKKGRIVAASAVAIMAVVAVAAPFAWIAPSYALPAQLTSVEPNAEYLFAEPGGGTGSMLLTGFDVPRAEVQPRGEIEINLTWQTASLMARNWSVFIHLTDEAGLIVGQRDTYPGKGLLATSDLEPGRRWTDHQVVRIDDNAYAPSELQVTAGLYDLATMERMILDNGSDSLEIGRIAMTARDSDLGIPNPMEASFAGEMELVGYSLRERILRPDSDLIVNLFWVGPEPIEANYSVSVQLHDEAGQNFAQVDGWPRGGELPTSAWQPGEIVEDEYTLYIHPEVPAGTYLVHIIVYELQDDSSIRKLKTVTTDGRLVDDDVIIGGVKLIP